METTTAFCVSCQRTVHLGEGDARFCPVCSGALAPADDVDERDSEYAGGAEGPARMEGATD